MANKKILEDNKSVEQVGKIERTGKNTCTLKMSGGEFCGNACRVAAYFMFTNYGIKNCKIKINGIIVDGKCNKNNSSISLNKSDLISSVKVLENGLTLIIQNEMTQLVIEEESRFYSANPTKKYAQKLKQKFSLDDIAVGIMFLNKNNELTPFVWVKKANTFYAETGCVSGSISCLLVLAKNTDDFETTIKQPSGGTYKLNIKNNKIYISGKCYFENKTKILRSEFFDFVNKNLEENFVRYEDLLVFKKLNKFTNKEEFVKFKNKISEAIVRETVAKKLQNIDEKLQKLGFSLKILCGYRKLSEQTQKFKNICFLLKNKDLSKKELYKKVHNYIAVPKIAGHPTGGAVDVAITCNQTNKMLEFGTGYLDFIDNKKVYVFSPFVSKLELKNRLLLRNLMLEEGFAPFDGEWWHFSYGDKEWAVYYNLPFFLYSQKELPKA